MAKKSAIEKNKKRQRMVLMYKDKRGELKREIMDKTISIEKRYEASQKLAKMPRDGSRSRIRLRCEVTGRPRGNYRKLRVSRIVFRNLASFGLLPGIQKDSW